VIRATASALFLATLALFALAGSPRAAHARQAQGVPTVAAGNIVFHHWPGQELLARRLIATLDDAGGLPALPIDVLSTPPAVDVWLAPDAARFDSLTGGYAPDWGAGIAIPDRSFIVLPAYASPRGGQGQLPGVLRHEIAHVALHRYLGDARLPRWFSEGYATWSAGQLDLDAAWILRLAFVTGSAPPLDSLVLDWPAGVADARVAYLLSASAVEYLHDNGGDRVMSIFLDRWRETGAFETALRDVYGLSLSQLERYWGRSVRRRYGWVLFLAQSSVVWALLTVMVLALFVVRRRRDRARLARMKANELPERPAFWLGEDPSLPPEPGEPPGEPPGRGRDEGGVEEPGGGPPAG
jgi:hypothetical protein